MNPSPVIGLIENAALLLALGVLLDLTLRSGLAGRLWTRGLIGLALGTICVAIMINPWTFGSGIIFDTRTIILSVGGLFFGALPAGIAAVIAAAFRIYMGGSGVAMGVGTIVTSSLIGIAWRRYRRQELSHISTVELLIFGLSVHSAVLLWTLALPRSLILHAISVIAPSFLILYPLATMILGKLLTGQLAHTELTKALEKSETNYRQLVESVNSMILRVDRSGRVTFSNKFANAFFGFPLAKGSEETILRAILPESGKDRRDLAESTERLFDGPNSFDAITSETVRSDGQPAWVSWTHRKITDQEGKIDEALFVGNDITEFKKAVNALEQSEERYRTVADFTYDWEYWIDPDGKLIYVSPACERITGYSSAEFVSDSRLIEKMVHREYRDNFLSHIQEVSLSPLDDQHGLDFKIITRTGETKWINHMCRAVHSKEGKFLGRRGSNRDITDRKLAEDALSESERKYRVLADGAMEGILVAQDGKLKFVNPRTLEIVGYRPEELLGTPFTNFIHPEDREMVMERHYRRLNGEDLPSRYSIRIQTRAGAEKIVEIDSGMILWDDGPAVLVFINDITERLKVEESSRMLATAIEQAAEAIMVTDFNGLIQYVNPAFGLITGYSPHEIIGKNPNFLNSGAHDQNFHEELWSTITKGNTWKGRITNRRKDGTLYHEEASISPVRDPNGTISHYVKVTRDISLEVSLQSELAQAQKMEAVGTLAGGIAHDFNNLLQVVVGYSELMLAKKSLDESSLSSVGKILEAARSGADLVRRLLTFSRKVEPVFQTVDINERVRNVEPLLRRTIHRMIEIRLKLEDPLPLIDADPVQIDQVLFNLALNARDAMPDKGVLEIETLTVTLDENYRLYHGDAKPGQYVLLKVSDSGHGMTEDTLNHIFEPFYTTKGFGRGTGLGLATVYGIVKQHGGHIECQSDLGKGTSFMIHFPKSIHENRNQLDQHTPLPGFGRETILLVEDEEKVRHVAERFLSGAGYKVIIAVNGIEALELYSSHREEIALVILDWIMPEMGGRECLETLKNLNGSVRVIIASGFAIDVSELKSFPNNVRASISKPYRLVDLLTEVRQALS
jgi:PAS domain S-box-containing protein